MAIISLGTEPCRLTNVSEGQALTDAVNVGQLAYLTSTQWGIFQCDDDYRTVTGPGGIENFSSIYNSPIGQANLKTTKRHQLYVNVPGIYQVNCRATFSAETSAAGTLQIKSGTTVVGEGHPFSIGIGEAVTLEMGQLVFLSPTEYLSVCLNITSIKGRLTYAPGTKTQFSLFLVQKVEAP